MCCTTEVAMPTAIVTRNESGFAVRVEISYGSSMLDSEESIQRRLNEARVLAIQDRSRSRSRPLRNFTLDTICVIVFDVGRRNTLGPSKGPGVEVQFAPVLITWELLLFAEGLLLGLIAGPPHTGLTASILLGGSPVPRGPPQAGRSQIHAGNGKA